MKREKGHKNLQYIYILFIFQFQVRPAFDSEDFLPKKRCMNLRVPEIWTKLRYGKLKGLRCCRKIWTNTKRSKAKQSLKSLHK